MQLNLPNIRCRSPAQSWSLSLLLLLLCTAAATTSTATTESATLDPWGRHEAALVSICGKQYSYDTHPRLASMCLVSCLLELNNPPPTALLIPCCPKHTKLVLLQHEQTPVCTGNQVTVATYPFQAPSCSVVLTVADDTVSFKLIPIGNFIVKVIPVTRVDLQDAPDYDSSLLLGRVDREFELVLFPAQQQQQQQLPSSNDNQQQREQLLYVHFSNEPGPRAIMEVDVLAPPHGNAADARVRPTCRTKNAISPVRVWVPCATVRSGVVSEGETRIEIATCSYVQWTLQGVSFRLGGEYPQPEEYSVVPVPGTAVRGTGPGFITLQLGYSDGDGAMLVEAYEVEFSTGTPEKLRLYVDRSVGCDDSSFAMPLVQTATTATTGN